MKLFIIRHAQSVNNALADERDRVSDPSLTELGHHQAQLLAEHLAIGKNPELSKWTSVEATVSHNRRSYDITQLYCSAMHRSLQTAQPIAQALNLTPEIWLDIHEHGGIFLDHGEEGGIRGLSRQNQIRNPGRISDLHLARDHYRGGLVARGPRRLARLPRPSYQGGG